MLSSAIAVHLRRLSGTVALIVVLTALLPSVAAGQSTYLKQVKTSTAGTVKIYATSDPYNDPWITLEFGAASVRGSLSPIDAEAAHSGGAYALEGGTTSGRVTRYTASGAIDTLYAARGVLTVGPGNTRLHEAPSGHLYVLGERLARYTPNGRLDTEFASQPAATVCSTGTRPHDLVVQPDGALVLCVGTTGSFVSRITTAGEIRTDYGDDGRAMVPAGQDGRLQVDQAGNLRVHMRSNVFTVSALTPTGQALHAPVALPQNVPSTPDFPYTFVFDDGTTWVAASFGYYPGATGVGMQGITPDGRPFGPWPVGPPINHSMYWLSPRLGPIIRSGSTGVLVHYGYFTGSNSRSYDARTRTLNQQDAPSTMPAPTLIAALVDTAPPPVATLVWRSTPGAVGYDVSIDSYYVVPLGQTALNPPVTETTTDTMIVLPVAVLKDNYNRVWRVRSRGADGRAGAWSNYGAVRTHFLPRPSLVTRFEGRSTESPVTLRWNDNSDLAGLTYSAQVSQSRVFDTSVWDAQTPYGTPTLTTPSLPDGLYYWRVNAKSSNPSIFGPYSTLDSFVVSARSGFRLEALPQAPVAASVTFPLWLSWSAAPDATAYDWQVSSTATFTTIADSGRSTLLRAEAKVAAGAYYWRVRGRAGATVSAFSSPAPFSVSLPLVPILLSPDTVTPSPVTVGWQASAGAERYRVYIRSSNAVVLDSLVSATQTSITVPLPQQRVYTVSVAAESGTNVVWSTTRSFTTQGAVSADSPALSTASVVVAPNPTAGNLVVRSTSSEVLRYDLVSILGAVVARGSLPEGETTVPRNGLSPGVYVLRVYHAGQPAQALRVVLL